MVDVSGIPNMGFGGGGYFGGIPNQQPAMSAAQINAGIWGNYSPQQAQATLNNIYGPQGFGGQPAYYAGQGAAYGRNTGGFGTPGSNPGWQDPQPPDQPSPWEGTGFDPIQYLQNNPDVAAAVGNNPMGAFEHARTYGIPEGRAGTEGLTRVYINAPPAAPPQNTLPSLSPLNNYQGTGYDAHNPSIYGGAAQQNVGQGYGGGASAPQPNFDFRWGDTPNVSGRPFQDVYEDWFSGITGNQGARGKVGGWEGSYLERNPDVLEAAKASGRGMNAFAQEHANLYGRAEGRELFDPVKYLQANQDVAAAGMDAYDHYNQFGRKEGREATWGNVFNPDTYLRLNTDVQQAGMDPRTHWLKYGQSEGRQGGGVVTDTRDEIARLLTGQGLGVNQPSANPSYYDPSTYQPTGAGAGGWQDLYGLGGRFAAAGGGAGGGSLTPQQLVNQGNAVNMPSGQFGGHPPNVYGAPSSGYLGIQSGISQDPFGGWRNPADMNAGGGFPADYQQGYYASPFLNPSGG